jgi:prepilin-type N-terminal cleavage/methylation domain-containing protein
MVRSGSSGFPRTGFTLVELLITIAIIAVLVAFALPSLGRVRESAANARCTSQIKQVGNAFFSYAADHNGVLPTAWRMDKGYRENWNDYLGPYLAIDDGDQISLSPKALSCPAKSSFNLPYSAYCVNYNIVISLEPGVSGVPWIDTGAKRVTSDIDPRTFIIADGQGLLINSPVHWKMTTDYDGDGIVDSFSGVPFNGVDFRHAGRANFFLRDGSVASLSSRQWATNHNNVWGAAID